MRAVLIELNGEKTRRELHKELQAKLEFPEYYGANLDALHDMLTEITEDTYLLLQINAEGEYAAYVEKILRVIKDSVSENPRLTAFAGTIL